MMSAISPIPTTIDVIALWWQDQWRFDLLSAFIGAAVAVLAMVLLYRYRMALAGGWQRVGDGVAGVRSRFSAGLEERYRQRVVAAGERVQVLGIEAALEDVYVAPHLLAPLPSPTEQLAEEQGLADDAIRERRLRAAIHQRDRRWPLADVLRAANHLVVTGPAGAGKTTLLAYLALTFARRQAAERLGVDDDFLPLLVPLGALARRSQPDEARGKKGKQADAGPAELLLEQVAADHRRLGRRAVADLCRRWLAAGQCLVLLDGLDEVPAEQREHTARWVADLAAAHPDNHYILTTEAGGHTTLLQAGFAGTRLSQFDQARIGEYIESWGQATEAESLAELEESVASHPGWLRWAAHPLTLAWLVQVYREDGDLPTDRTTLYKRVVEWTLGAVDQGRQPAEEGWAVLGRLALHLCESDRGAVSRADAESLAAEALSPPDEADGARSRQKEARAWFKALADDNWLLERRAEDEWAFAHADLQDYLAAWQVAETGDEQLLLAHVFDPRWQEVVGFYSQMRPVGGVVAALLSAGESVLHRDLFLAADCLADACEADGQTRRAVLTRLGQVFLQVGQPVALRLQSARALARLDDKGVAYLFGQALRHSETGLRQAAVWGLAWLGGRRVLEPLKAALGDSDWTVRVAAAQALALFRGNRVVEWLTGALADEDDDVRRAAAESLAVMGEEAHDILREAVEDEDIFLRRAAIYGLGRIGGPEIEALFDHIRRSDKQWYVRSAAEEVLTHLAGSGGDLATRRAQDEGWLIAWAAEGGRGMGSAKQAEQTLVEALRDERWAIRVAAAETLGALGGPAAIGPVQQAMDDEDEFVREAAFVALKEMALRGIVG